MVWARRNEDVCTHVAKVINGEARFMDTLTMVMTVFKRPSSISAAIHNSPQDDDCKLDVKLTTLTLRRGGPDGDELGKMVLNVSDLIKGRSNALQLHAKMTNGTLFTAKLTSEFVCIGKAETRYDDTVTATALSGNESASGCDEGLDSSISHGEELVDSPAPNGHENMEQNFNSDDGQNDEAGRAARIDELVCLRNKIKNGTMYNKRLEQLVAEQMKENERLHGIEQVAKEQNEEIRELKLEIRRDHKIGEMGDELKKTKVALALAFTQLEVAQLELRQYKLKCENDRSTTVLAAVSRAVSRSIGY